MSKRTHIHPKPMNPEEGKPTPTQPAEGAPARNGAFDESGNVDQIRNILFGTQMRGYEERFQRLEERLVREAGELRTELQKRLDALETFMKSEVESLVSRLKGEHSDRCQAIERAARDLAEATRSLELKISSLDERTGKDLRELRQQLLEQSKTLGVEIKERHEQMKSGLETEAQKIRHAMTARESLGDLFSEVALRLKNEFRVPGA